VVCLSLTRNRNRGVRTASKTAEEGPYDDFRILTSLRRRIELLFAATLPLCETFGLEQAYSQTEKEAEWHLTPEERKTIQELSQNLPLVWKSPSTTNQERKQLLRLAIESVQLDGVSQAGQIEIQIRWRSGTMTRSCIKRTAPGEGSLKTPPNAVAQIHEMAGQYTYADIADRLNVAGCRTAFGRRFTSQHVGYICRRDKVGEQ
jgi:hypothetical protein